MYISKDEAGRLYADAMAKVDFGTTLYFEIIKAAIN